MPEVPLPPFYQHPRHPLKYYNCWSKWFDFVYGMCKTVNCSVSWQGRQASAHSPHLWNACPCYHLCRRWANRLWWRNWVDLFKWFLWRISWFGVDHVSFASFCSPQAHSSLTCFNPFNVSSLISFILQKSARAIFLYGMLRWANQPLSSPWFVQSIPLSDLVTPFGIFFLQFWNAHAEW